MYPVSLDITLLATAQAVEAYMFTKHHHVDPGLKKSTQVDEILAVFPQNSDTLRQFAAQIWHNYRPPRGLSSSPLKTKVREGPWSPSRGCSGAKIKAMECGIQYDMMSRTGL